MSILVVLIQFVFRVTFGVACAMGITSSKLVTSGFFRVHLWVLMGLNTLAGLCIYTQRESLHTKFDHVSVVLGFAIGLAVASYLGGAFWLYEKAGAGKAILYLVMFGGWLAAALSTHWKSTTKSVEVALTYLDVTSSGLLLGVTLSAMFLGHWYLNTPTMELRPLKRLVLLLAAAVIFRAIVNGAGLVLQVGSTNDLTTAFWIFVALRWLSGLLGVFILSVLTWFTLKIPNTQSATGILYAGVILAFIGELTSQFLTADTIYPL